MRDRRVSAAAAEIADAIARGGPAADDEAIRFALYRHGVIEPVEAVKAYHAVLGKLGLKPNRPLEEDLVPQAMATSYGATPAPVKQPSAKKASAAVDFKKMTPAERLAYHQSRLNRLFGDR